MSEAAVIPERKSAYDRVPVPVHLMAIIRKKSDETGIKQQRIVSDLLTQSMKQRRWITDESDPVEAESESPAPGHTSAIVQETL